MRAEKMETQKLLFACHIVHVSTGRKRDLRKNVCDKKQYHRKLY